jgi:hypothetical protein
MIGRDERLFSEFNDRTRLFMGSISTFLVQKSPVPVTVIKPQKKQKKVTRKPIQATGLSESKQFILNLLIFNYKIGVQSGQLAVDELSKK